jgi:aspartate carbamoyltransferase catalytic subunit
MVVSLDVSKSSSSKGETLFDTAANLDAMGPDAIVVRHKSSGVPHILANYVNCPIINGGDGSHAHPTQALLDLFTIKRHFGDIKGKKVIVSHQKVIVCRSEALSISKLQRGKN